MSEMLETGRVLSDEEADRLLSSGVPVGLARVVPFDELDREVKVNNSKDLQDVNRWGVEIDGTRLRGTHGSFKAAQDEVIRYYRGLNERLMALPEWSERKGVS